MQPESLFSLALYDVEAVAHREVSANPSPPAFYPVDEYKDLSLKEILDISDDFLFGDEDPLMTAPVHDTAVTVTVPLSMAQSLFTPVTPSSSGDFDLEPNPISYESEIQNSKKRSREESFDCDEEDEDEEGRRFRPYQSGQWSEKFAELCQYRQRMGHCLVPHTFNENLPLARWVKRQRYQYKLMVEGKPSTMTEERVTALQDIGFVWDSQGAAWEERLAELMDFVRIFAHANVPSNYAENPQLATWVKCQRRQYKLFIENKPSNMTQERINKLESLGFEWELRSYRKSKA